MINIDEQIRLIEDTIKKLLSEFLERSMRDVEPGDLDKVLEALGELHKVLKALKKLQ